MAHNVDTILGFTNYTVCQAFLQLVVACTREANKARATYTEPVSC